jgi:hypothetical protein
MDEFFSSKNRKKKENVRELDSEVLLIAGIVTVSFLFLSQVACFKQGK